MSEYQITEVPPRGLAKRNLFEIRNASGERVLTCESRRLAERWAAKLADR